MRDYVFWMNLMGFGILRVCKVYVSPAIRDRYMAAEIEVIAKCGPAGISFYITEVINCDVDSI